MKFLETLQEKPSIQLGLIVLSSMLWTLSIPAMGIWWFQLFGLVPILLVLSIQTKASRVFLGFALFYFLFLVGSFYDLFLDGKQTLALSIGLIIVPLLWSIPAMLAHYLDKKVLKGLFLISFPILYVCQEVLQFYWDLSFTWTHIGLMNAENVFVRPLYQHVGIEGVGLYILILNACIVWVLLKSTLSGRIVPKPLVVVVIVISLPIVLRFLSSDTNVNHENWNIFHWNPTEEAWSSSKDDLETQVNLLAEALSQSSDSTIDLIVCPESYISDMEYRPLVVNTLYKHPAIQTLAGISRKHDCPILSGAILVQLYKSENPPTLSAKQKEPGVYYDIYNGSIFITPDGIVRWHGKLGMVPFSEHIPFQGLLNIPYKLGMSGYRTRSTYGSSNYEGPYTYKDMRIAPLVCYEAQSPSIVKKYEKDATNLFVVLSNNWTSSKRAMARQKVYVQTIEFQTLMQTEFLQGIELQAVY